jgi:tRNA U34 5-methylaminomethyl-2-thiouridine-forming methyltransferase MnmC
MDSPRVDLVLTGDGSKTLFLTDRNEHYHSHNGAVQESRHVFIHAGLDYFLKKHLSDNATINILEVGMGTGLNAFLACLYALRFPQIQFRYSAIEPFPIATQLIAKLGYAVFLKAEEHNPVFEAIHSGPFDRFFSVSANTNILKKKEKFEDVQSLENADVVFFDAFSPGVQPELWTAGVFSKIFTLLNPGGLLVTYCAKGEVRRMLKELNFTVERLPGPPGKREMLRAVKSV